ncbi:MAG: ABC transporter permease, partial [Anaerolineae bacterium]|nr:ABC transporter permease [Anaerolineae bacterium]
MLRFLGRRLGLVALVVVAIVFFGYLGMGMAPNSQRARPNYNLWLHSRLAWQQTTRYLAGAAQGDFGTVPSRRGPIPVRDILADTYPKSMGLLLAALALASAVGLAVGTAAALARHRPLVLPLLTMTVLGISVPSFFAALLLQVANVQVLQTFHYRLAYSGGFGWDRHMVLPTLVLAARPVAYLTRAVFLTLSQTMTEDYIRTAWAKGLNLPLVLLRHALRNIAVPV